jgi:hypothetical protein
MVHRFRGEIIFFPFFFSCFVEVPVFAASFLPGMVRYSFQNSGLAVVSVSILLVIYVCASEITFSHSWSCFSSIIFHLESITFRTGEISFFIHMFANTEYAVASSRGVISQVHSARGAQYKLCFFREVTQIFSIKFTIFFSHHAR